MPGEHITRCPICKKEVSFYENPYRPFCSRRCKMIDLGAWFKEDYRIETEPFKVHIDGETMMKGKE